MSFERTFAKGDKNKVISKCKQIFSFKIMVEPREKATRGY